MTGPIPRGKWKIGAAEEIPGKGPICMRLTPCDGTETFGRAGFLLHGDSADHPGEASEGCIVQGPSVRRAVAESGDTELEVI